MKILLVEDDEPTGSALSEALTEHHYLVNLATDGRTGLELAEAFDYDLILLDVLVPKLDGITLCRKLRSRGYQKPILLLTAKDSNTDRVTGLDAGADDYVVKPYDLSELLARIRALLRRGGEPMTPVLRWGDLQLNASASEVTYGDTLLTLTPKEYSLLELFLRHPQRVFSRSDILDRVWSFEDAPAESAVTTHIKDLRQKLKAGGLQTEIIETVYGFGYRLKALPGEKSEQTARKSKGKKQKRSEIQADPPPLPADQVERHLSRLQALLDRFRGTFVEQVAVLEQAATALQAGGLAPDLQQQARQEAHKLSGSLGVFGYHQGSTLAQEAEYLLMKANLEAADADRLSQLVAALQHELTQTPPPPAQELLPKLPSSTVLVVDEDVALTQQLQAEAKARGIQITIAPDAQTARQAIAASQPDVILLDLTFDNTAGSGLSLLSELTAQYPTLPILVFTGQDSLAERVELSRLGVRRCLHKPITPDQILNEIAQELPMDPHRTPKVMVVDDDPVTLAALSELLRSQGLQVIPLEDPQQFWQVLTTTSPDLLVLDLEMPTFSGIDLCRVIRQDVQWSHLPILVVTAHTGAEAIQQVFAAGADDFIGKPVAATDFVTRIISRIKRDHMKRREFPPISYQQR